jgi:hypothetical protein
MRKTQKVSSFMVALLAIIALTQVPSTANAHACKGKSCKQCAHGGKKGKECKCSDCGGDAKGHDDAKVGNDADSGKSEHKAE